MGTRNYMDGALFAGRMPPIEAILVEALFGVMAGAVYGFIWFGRNRLKKENPENFSRRKFLATLLVSAAVGGVLAASGASVTFPDVATKLTTYGFLIVLVEGLLKTLWEFRPDMVRMLLG